MTTLTEEDVGKRVETTAGTRVGTVAAINGETVYVEIDPRARDSIKAAFGWQRDRDDVVPIAGEDVREVTDEAVRVEPPDEGGHDPVIERDEDAETRDLGPTSGSGTGTSDDRSATSGDRSGDRHSSVEDAPPEGERTVTEDRGRDEDR